MAVPNRTPAGGIWAGTFASGLLRGTERTLEVLADDVEDWMAKFAGVLSLVALSLAACGGGTSESPRLAACQPKTVTFEAAVDRARAPLRRCGRRTPRWQFGAEPPIRLRNSGEVLLSAVPIIEVRGP